LVLRFHQEDGCCEEGGEQEIDAAILSFGRRFRVGHVYQGSI
jgi:hypothetical protein